VLTNVIIICVFVSRMRGSNCLLASLVFEIDSFNVVTENKRDRIILM